MKVLQIFRSEPDEMVKQLSDAFVKTSDSSSVRLFEGNVDWSKLVDDIFDHDKVVCWW